ncbi:hypothetical protein [Stigmatella aurantiaca]|uniref:Conserved uncharacterized protein n=1 Tax=Stigmatella aurantiaca (strain DW4/3-1) TaxID=378806 RepID=E3FDK4_STIAD|nr:hypothetical protein [Stigmatella aurantiaca]ADO70083.1 conserved uncharacterized protein [Stigmatella aurantiaca DW4/3-1]
MRAAFFSLCLLLVPLASVAQERPSKAVPALAKAPKLDGILKDFSSPLTLRPPAAVDASAAFTARVAWRKETLYVGVEVTDDQVTAGDLLTLTLFFPGAGPTATGNTFRFAFDGKRATGPEVGTTAFAQEQVEAGLQRQGNKLSLEIALPVQAFPRFPAIDPLLFDLCLTYEDQDSVGQTPAVLSNCKDGGMLGEALKLPDEFRKGLKLKPPPDILALEAVKGGWLGWSVLHHPAWVEADEPLNTPSLRALVAQDSVDPPQVGVNVPESLTLPGGRAILTVVSGKNPYATEGKCDGDQELRLGLYLVVGRGKTAQRVLEWPAATCALGRALSVSLDEEGALTIGYSNGATINFVWSADHFERTELGKR